MKDRIELIRQREGMSSSDFAEAIGVARATVTHILQGRNKPSLDVMLGIHKRFPQVSLDWLLTGKGEMHGKEARNFQSDLFSGPENRLNPDIRTERSEYARENALESPYSLPEIPVKEVVKYIEKPTRKITEIRIFFDDNTYEIFKPDL